MRGKSVDLGPLFLVASETDGWLGLLAKDRVVADVDPVAIGTDDIAALMVAALPMGPNPSLVTGQAGAGLGLGL